MIDRSKASLVMITILVFILGIGAIITVDAPTQVKNTPVIDVRTYGAKMDGVTNDAPAFANAITALPPYGGIVYVPSGIMLVNATTTIVRNNVRIVCAGGSGSVWSPGNGTTIKYNGALNGDIMQFTGAGIGHGSMLYGGSIENCTLDGNNLAKTDLRLTNTDSFTMNNSELRGFVTGDAGLVIDTTDTSGVCGNAYGTFNNVKIASTNVNTNGIRMGNYAANREVCSNTFSDLYVDTSVAPNNHQILLDHTDNNLFSNVHAGGLFGNVTVTSIVTDGTGTNATINATAHGIPIGTEGTIWILNPCTTPVTPTVPCNDVGPLKGAFRVIPGTANTLALSGLSGLSPSTTYYAENISGVSIWLNQTWYNSFANMLTLTGVYSSSVCDSGYGRNSFTNWNPFEYSYTDAAYANNIPTCMRAIDINGVGHNQTGPSSLFRSRRYVSGQTISSGSYQRVAFAGSTYHVGFIPLTNGGSATADSTWTIPETGNYQITGSISYPNGTGTSALRVSYGAGFLMDTVQLPLDPTAGAHTTLKLNTQYYLTKGETIYFEAYQNSGVGLALDVNISLSYASITKLF